MAGTMTLVQKMRKMATEIDRTHPEQANSLRERADELEEATDGYWGENQTVTVKQFLGCWARARLLWRDLTGESLI